MKPIPPSMTMEGRKYYNVFSNERVTLIRVREGKEQQYVEYRRDTPVRDDAGFERFTFIKPLYVWAICYRPYVDQAAPVVPTNIQTEIA